MQVEQAIFTSVRNGRVQGYQLAARSEGVDDRLAQALIRWGPSHAALCETEPTAESVNFHLVCNGQFALSRTVYGGAEYSDRGGFQLFTQFALFDGEQLANYDFNPVALFRHARTEGGWQWSPGFSPHLPALTLPDPTAATFWESPTRRNDDGFARELLDRISRRERLAVTSCHHPLPMLQRIFQNVREQQRLEISFTTGLKPTANRPFLLHFLPGEFPELRRSASALGLTCLSAA